jgi:phosphoglucosamine mutase
MKGIVEILGSKFSLGGINILLDCANGATSFIAPSIFKRLGAKVYVLNNNPDGKNINHLCGALYPKKLRNILVSSNANLAIAFDGDGDRVIFLDEKGAVRDGDYTLAISARKAKEEGLLPNNKVVATVMSNLGLERYLDKIGINLIRTKVGDRFVTEEMLKQKVLIGGEQSGHIVYFDSTTTGDGIITALKILKAMKQEEKTLSMLCKDLKKFPQYLINVGVRSKPPFEKVPSINSAIKQCEKILDKSGRVLLRYSGTEPVARIMIEGEDRKLVKKLAERLATVIKDNTG